MKRHASIAQVDRSLLDGVLAVVRQLGAAADLREALDLIADAVVDILGFGAVAINVTTPEDLVRVEAAVGPPGVETLLGTTNSLAAWLELLETGETWGALRYFSHERDQTLIDRFVTWTPPVRASSEPDAWDPDDSLLAPLWDGDRLLGVLSVDEPRTGRRPDPEQCTVLELFAVQAANAIRDAQVREAADANRREIETRWQMAFEHSPSGVALVDTDGKFRQINEKLAAMLDYSVEDLLLMTFVDVTYPDDVKADLELFQELLDGRRDNYQMEKRYIRGDGQIIHCLLHVSGIRRQDGSVQTIVSQVSDLTERKMAEERLEYERTHDRLTGLPTRALLVDQLAHVVTHGEPVGVLFCDLDRFKLINDSLGRTSADELLRAAARALETAVPPGCTLARSSGDEFAVLAPGYADPAALHALGSRLIDTLGDPLTVGSLELTIGMSVGAAVIAPWHQHPDEVMREAEQALLRAKQRGRGRVEVYDPIQDHPFTVDDLALEQALRAALETGDGLAVYVQPIVSVADLAVVGVESLIRWRHPTRGTLQPAAFLPLAEHSGLIVPLGWRMLELGARAAARAQSVAGGWLSINVDGGQLGRGVLPRAVRDALAANDLPADRLHLEITESALVDASPEAIREVREVADLGVSIALDDFGTGYSSLSLLRDLPITVVKIDRSFIAPIAEDRRAAALVRGLVVMCNSLDISTVAEGVETHEQLAVVTALGCDHAQGYLFGPPVPAGD